MISEIFSTSFLFSVAIIIIAVGGLFAYFNYRLSENNHKMQAMMGLVSTMAEEMQYFRSKIHSNPITTNNNDTHIVPNFLGGSNKEDELIEVSDSEIEEDDLSEVESEAESLETDDDLSEAESLETDELSEAESLDDDLSEAESLEDDLSANEIEAESLEEDNKKIITIDIDLGATNEMSFDSEEIEDTNMNDLNLSNLEDLDVSLKTIAIDMDLSNIGDTNITINKEKDDYKKMSLNKLRDLVCEKGLVKDASKLKKNELLKLLGAE